MFSFVGVEVSVMSALFSVRYCSITCFMVVSICGVVPMNWMWYPWSRLKVMFSMFGWMFGIPLKSIIRVVVGVGRLFLFRVM